MSHSLATSSLLKAVGVNGGAVGAAGATAAVKWITKDGIGALGRLLVRGFGLTAHHIAPLLAMHADPVKCSMGFGLHSCVWRFCAPFVVFTPLLAA